VVEFALVAPLAIVVTLAVAQYALFLYERNVVMGSLSEGVRVAATSGRTIADGQRAAGNLLREALGGRIAATVPVRGAVESGLVVLRADAALPSFVPGLPGLEVHMTAAMHKEEDLRMQDEARPSTLAGAARPAGSPAAAGKVGAPDGSLAAPDGTSSESRRVAAAGRDEAAG
jgi:hypothetical protein